MKTSDNLTLKKKSPIILPKQFNKAIIGTVKTCKTFNLL